MNSAVVVSLIIGVYATLNTQTLAHTASANSTCQAEYNEANNARSAALVGPLELERNTVRAAFDALFDLTTAGLNPAVNRDPAVMREKTATLNTALAEAISAREIADAARAAHPVLPTPTEFCGQ